MKNEREKNTNTHTQQTRRKTALIECIDMKSNEVLLLQQNIIRKQISSSFDNCHHWCAYYPSIISLFFFFFFFFFICKVESSEWFFRLHECCPSCCCVIRVMCIHSNLSCFVLHFFFSLLRVIFFKQFIIEVWWLFGSLVRLLCSINSFSKS